MIQFWILFRKLVEKCLLVTQFLLKKKIASELYEPCLIHCSFKMTKLSENMNFYPSNLRGKVPFFKNSSFVIVLEASRTMTSCVFIFYANDDAVYKLVCRAW